jgi:hypothetical protein
MQGDQLNENKYKKKKTREKAQSIHVKQSMNLMQLTNYCWLLNK